MYTRVVMPLPRATAQSTKDLKLPGHYGHSKKAGAKKASAKKKPAAGKAAGAKKLPPSFLKNMKKKGSSKK